MAIKIDGLDVVRIVEIDNSGTAHEVVRIMCDGVELWSGLNSCFAAGYWINSKPWTDNKGWKD